MRLQRISWIILMLFLGWLSLEACGKERTTPPKGDGANTTTDGGTTAQPDRTTAQPDRTTPQPDTRRRPEPPKPPPNTRCVSLFECAKTQQCGNPPSLSCLESCATSKKLEGQGKNRFDALKTCLQTSCSSCQPNDSACLDNCITLNCYKEWLACSTDVQYGTGGCDQLKKCVEACDKADPSCPSACYRQASIEANTIYAKNRVCDAKIKNQTATPDEKKDCYRHALTCQCPNDKPGQGTQKCADYITCVSQCNQDTCCVAKCRSSLAPIVLIQADNFTLCAADKCETSCGPHDKACMDQCILEKCPKEYLACQCPGVQPPGQGTQSCSAALTCADNCPLTDICCQARCTAKLKASSYQLYLQFARCLPKCGCGTNKSCLKNCTSKPSGSCFSEAVNCAQDR